jgi:hypothetical protein
MRGQRFLKAENLENLLVEDNVEQLLDRCAGFNHQPVEKWIDRKPTSGKS